MILIRHGESQWNEVYNQTGVSPDIPDPHLTARGREQVKRAAEALAQPNPIRRILVSPIPGRCRPPRSSPAPSIFPRAAGAGTPIFIATSEPPQPTGGNLAGPGFRASRRDLVADFGNRGGNC